MRRKPEHDVQKLTRRALLAVGARVTALGAVCATIGSTIIAACVTEPADPRLTAIANGSTASGDGYGYGYGYGDEPGDGYGYGYGDEPGRGDGNDHGHDHGDGHGHDHGDDHGHDHGDDHGHGHR
jgi:hypothetical protein